jgi:hypothetical protein
LGRSQIEGFNFDGLKSGGLHEKQLPTSKPSQDLLKGRKMRTKCKECEVFSVITKCHSEKCKLFGGTHGLHPQGRKVNQARI